MENESKTPSTPSRSNAHSDYEIETIRNELLRCPGLDLNCEAVQVALTTLQEVEDIIKVKRQLEMKDDDANFSKPSPALTTSSSSSHLFSHQYYQQQPAIPTHINVNNTNRDNYNASQHPPEKKCDNDHTKSSIIFKILRTLAIDIPLLSLFILTLSTFSLSHVYLKYLSPQLEHMKYTDENRTHDITYYNRVCPLGQMSTTKVEDLVIGDDFTTDECVEHMMVHGMSVYKDVIDLDTAKELRSYIVDKNKSLKSKDAIGVISNRNRWSFGIGANDHPSVSKALNQIATNEVLRPALEKIAGRNPAMIEMTAITAGHGAEDQFWHPDVVSMGSPAKYVKNFVPSYALFITLQDTTAEMGATGVCPGTYMCSNEDATDTCEGHGFQVADNDNVWKTGHGLLMNQQSFHRGAAHTDPTAPHRVVFIVTFSPRPKERGETRLLGQGGSYSTRWDMWGHTLNDLENAPTAMIQPWTTLRALGLYKPKGADWGWDFISQHSMRAASHGTGYEERMEFEEWVTIPQVLLPKFERHMSFEEYFFSCIQKWKSWAAMINGVALGTYFAGFILIGLIASVLDRKYSRSLFRGICTSTLRVATFYALAASITYYLLAYRIPSSSWASSIVKGNLLPPAFNIEESLKSKVFTQRDPFVIDENDILISDRYDDKILNSLVDVLKYHPGNMELNAHLRGAANTFSFVRKSDRRELAQNIVDDTFNRGSKFALLNDNSVWIPLTITEATDYVLSKLDMEVKPLLQSLSREAAFLMSQYRYGYMRSTAMSRRLSCINLSNLMERMSVQTEAQIFNTSHCKQNNDIYKATIPSAESKSTSFFITPTIYNFAGKGKKNLSSKRYRFPSLPKELHGVGANILQIGDVVEGQYLRIHNEWYKGKIVDITQGSQIDVQYLDGEVDKWLDSKNVKPFKPYSVGETVEVNLDGEDEFFEVKVVRLIGKKIVVKSKSNHKSFTVTESNLRRFY